MSVCLRFVMPNLAKYHRRLQVQHDWMSDPAGSLVPFLKSMVRGSKLGFDTRPLPRCRCARHLRRTGDFHSWTRPKNIQLQLETEIPAIQITVDQTDLVPTFNTSRFDGIHLDMKRWEHLFIFNSTSLFCNPPCRLLRLTIGINKCLRMPRMPLIE